jgi:hypothetical protein
MSPDAASDPIVPTSTDRAEAVKRAYEAELLARANVVGVGIGLRRTDSAHTEQVAVIVLVTRKVPRSQLAPRDVIPSEIEGVPVDVQEVGDIKALR